ncbi:MAG: hypothetical protein PHN98_10385 [Smithellaceae bacterium]|nr:hypothetical protein [Smithellaceae bacterium]
MDPYVQAVQPQQARLQVQDAHPAPPRTVHHVDINQLDTPKKAILQGIEYFINSKSYEVFK